MKLMQIYLELEDERYQKIKQQQDLIEIDDRVDLWDDIKDDYEYGFTYYKGKYKGEDIQIRMNKNHGWKFNRNNDPSIHNLSLVNIKDDKIVWTNSPEEKFVRMQVDNIRDWEDAKSSIGDFFYEIDYRNGYI